VGAILVHLHLCVKKKSIQNFLNVSNAARKRLEKQLVEDVDA